MFLLRAGGFALALGVPALLAFDGVQAKRYVELEAEVVRLEKREAELVEKNHKLIAGISVLSSADRIAVMAVEELGMRKAQTDDIVRIEMREKAE
jgi:cell division protein FtsB